MLIIKRKAILILGKEETKGLDNITLTAEAEYSINFSRSQRKLCLRLHYNGSNSFCLLMPQKYISLKQKILKLKRYPLFLGNISKDFFVDDM